MLNTDDANGTNGTHEQNGFDEKHKFPARFGEFGGQYVPESLMDCLSELEEGFNAAIEDPKFWEEYRSYYDWMGRPGHLHLAERLTEHAGGANIWLKREDLNQQRTRTGAHCQETRKDGDYCRDWSWSARCCNGHGMRQVQHEVHHLHGS